MDDVVALGTPSDVVGVAESVDLERADVGWQERKVLCGRGEHVPGIEVEERHEEVEANGRAGRDNKIREDVVTQGEGGERGF